MQQNIDNKDSSVAYKSLLTADEYQNIIDANPTAKGDTQTNYYFDTSRFTLKACDASLRVKETSKGMTLILEKKKGYQNERKEFILDDDSKDKLFNNGIITDEEIDLAVKDIIHDQKIINYMSFSTDRVNVLFGDSKFAVDKCKYFNVVDYEVEFHTRNKNAGKTIFVQFLKQYNINYKKSTAKLKRAYNELMNQ